jgi:hypothetical protein
MGKRKQILWGRENKAKNNFLEKLFYRKLMLWAVQLVPL